jgi:hypothetical protein
MPGTLFPSAEQSRGWEVQVAVERLRRELQSVTDRLIAEFGDRIDRDLIARVVREEVLLLDRARVREFVSIIAWRLARQRLTEDLARARQDITPHREAS